MTSPELLALLLEFSTDKLALLERHVAGARQVPNYDFNNTYQYIINREDTQLGWLRGAVEEVGGTFPDTAPAIPVPAGGKRDAVEHSTIADDWRLQLAFVNKWRPLVDPMTQARHRKMLEVVLGETVEHQRFFEQMLAGRQDVLGRRTGGESTGGGVLAVRWIEQ